MLCHLIRASFLGLMLVAGGYSPAGAGGLYLNEFATPSMGTAGAGQEAYAGDASTSFAFHNPAGMTRLDGHQVSLGAGVLMGDTEFDTDADTPFAGGNGGDQAGWQRPPWLGCRLLPRLKVNRETPMAIARAAASACLTTTSPGRQ